MSGLWNWKAALFSSVCRAAVFFAANLADSVDAAIAAAQIEFVYRAVASGFYGGLTERFSRLRPTGMATTAAVVLIPAVAHIAEYLIHSTAGTPRLGSAVAASVAFSVVTTRFNLFAMRRGFLTVGRGSRSLASDAVELTRLCAGGVTSWIRSRVREVRAEATR